MNGSNFLHIIMSLMLLALGFFGGVVYNRYFTINNVVNYNTCVSAGYEILNTFPAQCKTPNGRIFVDEASVPNTLPPQNEEEGVSDFEKCVSEGNRVTNTDPKQCSTPDGKTFIEQKSPDDFPVTDTINPGVIDSFEKCVAAGFPIAESFPRQCNTPDGKTFMEGLSPVSAPATY